MSLRTRVWKLTLSLSVGSFLALLLSFGTRWRRASPIKSSIVFPAPTGRLPTECGDVVDGPHNAAFVVWDRA